MNEKDKKEMEAMTASDIEKLSEELELQGEKVSELTILVILIMHFVFSFFTSEFVRKHALFTQLPSGHAC